jgi:hypothetical protein
LRCAQYPTLEKALQIWIEGMKAKNAILTHDIIKSKALQLSADIVKASENISMNEKTEEIKGLEKFKASVGWCNNFCSRLGIRLYGENSNTSSSSSSSNTGQLNTTNDSNKHSMDSGVESMDMGMNSHHNALYLHLRDLAEDDAKLVDFAISESNAAVAAARLANEERERERKSNLDKNCGHHNERDKNNNLMNIGTSLSSSMIGDVDEALEVGVPTLISNIVTANDTIVSVHTIIRWFEQQNWREDEFNWVRNRIFDLRQIADLAAQLRTRVVP